MKIYSINPNEIPKARVGEVAETLPSRKESISPQRTEPTMNPSTFRSYAEALVIAHTARSIIAKAVEAASQLQGLAARTLTGESVDRSEVLKACLLYTSPSPR
ncbi:MAG: hypothetical protein N2316_13400, partial [Spirochaetes bacterium]|nr:hypothetical protein [Spirochaetota bacterium]